MATASRDGAGREEWAGPVRCAFKIVKLAAGAFEAEHVLRFLHPHHHQEPPPSWMLSESSSSSPTMATTAAAACGNSGGSRRATPPDQSTASVRNRSRWRRQWGEGRSWRSGRWEKTGFTTPPRHATGRHASAAAAVSPTRENRPTSPRSRVCLVDTSPFRPAPSSFQSRGNATEVKVGRLLAATASNKDDRWGPRSPAVSSSLHSWRLVINPETGGCHRRPRPWGRKRGSNGGAREIFLGAPYASAPSSALRTAKAQPPKRAKGPEPEPLLCVGPSPRVWCESCVRTASKQQHRTGSISSTSATGSRGKFVRCWKAHSPTDSICGSLVTGVCDSSTTGVLGPTPPNRHVATIVDQECGGSPQHPSMPETGVLAPATPTRLVLVFDAASACCRKRGRGRPHNKTTTTTATATTTSTSNININTNTNTNTNNTSTNPNPTNANTIATTAITHTTVEAKPKHCSTTDAPRAVVDINHHYDYHRRHHHHHHQNSQPTVYGDVWIPQQYFPGRSLVSPRRRTAVGQTDWTPAAAVAKNGGKAKKRAELTPDYHPVRQTTPGKDYHLVRRTVPRRECYATRYTNGLEFSPEKHGARTPAPPTPSCATPSRRPIEPGALFSRDFAVQASRRCGGGGGGDGRGGGDGGGGRSYVRTPPPEAVRYGLEGANSGPSVVSPPLPSPFLARLLEDAATTSGGDGGILSLHRGEMEELLDDAKGFLWLTGTGVIAEAEADHRHERQPDNQNHGAYESQALAPQEDREIAAERARLRSQRASRAVVERLRAPQSVFSPSHCTPSRPELRRSVTQGRFSPVGRKLWRCSDGLSPRAGQVCLRSAPSPGRASFQGRTLSPRKVSLRSAPPPGSPPSPPPPLDATIRWAGMGVGLTRWGSPRGDGSRRRGGGIRSSSPCVAAESGGIFFSAQQEEEEERGLGGWEERGKDGEEEEDEGAVEKREEEEEDEDEEDEGEEEEEGEIMEDEEGEGEKNVEENGEEEEESKLREEEHEGLNVGEWVGGGQEEEDEEEKGEEQEEEEEGRENEDEEKGEKGGGEEEERSCLDGVERSLLGSTAKSALERLDAAAALSDRFPGGQNTSPPRKEPGIALKTNAGRIEAVAASDGEVDSQVDNRVQSAGDGATRASAAGEREARNVITACANAETDGAQNCGGSNMVRQKKPATQGTNPPSPAENRCIIYSVVIPWDGQQQ